MSLLGTRVGREGRRAERGRMERPLPPWEVRGGMAVCHLQGACNLPEEVVLEFRK